MLPDYAILRMQAAGFPDTLVQHLATKLQCLLSQVAVTFIISATRSSNLTQRSWVQIPVQVKSIDYFFNQRYPIVFLINIFLSPGEFPHQKSYELKSQGLNETGKLGWNHSRKEKKNECEKGKSKTRALIHYQP